MKYSSFLGIALVATFAACTEAAFAEAEVGNTVLATDKTKLKGDGKVVAALFVEDATPQGGGAKYLPALGARMAAALNKSGFGVQRVEDFLGISEALDDDDSGKRTLLTERVKEGKALDLDNASKVQLARDMESDCYFQCSITDVSVEDIGATGAVQYDVELTLNIYGSARGDGVYGDVVRVSKRETKLQFEKNSKALFTKSLLEAVEGCAKSFANGMDELNIRPARMAKVRFTGSIAELDLDVRGIPASVSVDGFAMGTTESEIEMPTGVHTVKVQYPYCEEYETRARFVDGQVYNVELRLTTAGIERLKSAQKYVLAMRSVSDDIEAKDEAYGRLQKEFETADAIRNNESSTGIAIAKQESDSRITIAEQAANTEDYISRETIDATLKIALNAGELSKDAAEATAVAQATAVAADSVAETHATNVQVIEADNGNLDNLAEVVGAKAEVEFIGKSTETDNKVKELDAESRRIVAEGEATKLKNSFDREEIVKRHTQVEILSEGDGIKAVDSDPFDGTIINADPTSEGKVGKTPVEK